MRALITGITGMDGSYLTELLLSKGYEVHGIVRHIASELTIHRFWRLQGIIDKIVLHHADLISYPTVEDIVRKVMPDELYHLGAMSYVGYSFHDQYSCFKINLDATHYLLDITKKFNPKCKFYFAATSEMYGNTTKIPQTERTPFNPCSPYGISKYAAYCLCQMYRKFGIPIYCGILFNHTSERRGEIFASRKITKTVAEIARGKKDKLIMGDISSKRDFGYAPEYVEAMWMMMQGEPDNYVIATNETHSIEEIINIAFNHVGLNPEKYLEISKGLYRPLELHILQGDYSKAKRILGWQPKMKFRDIIKRMVDYDLSNCS